MGPPGKIILLLKNSDFSRLVSSSPPLYLSAFPSLLALGSLEKDDAGEQKYDNRTLLFPFHSFMMLIQALQEAKFQFAKNDDSEKRTFEMVINQSGTCDLVALFNQWEERDVFQFR